MATNNATNGSTKVTTFLVSTTWNMTPGAKLIQVFIFDGGRGGGSGRQGASATASGGGGGAVGFGFRVSGEHH